MRPEISWDASIEYLPVGCDACSGPLNDVVQVASNAAPTQYLIPGPISDALCSKQDLICCLSLLVCTRGEEIKGAFGVIDKLKIETFICQI